MKGDWKRMRRSKEKTASQRQLNGHSAACNDRLSNTSMTITGSYIWDGIILLVSNLDTIVRVKPFNLAKVSPIQMFQTWSHLTIWPESLTVMGGWGNLWNNSLRIQSCLTSNLIEEPGLSVNQVFHLHLLLNSNKYTNDIHVWTNPFIDCCVIKHLVQSGRAKHFFEQRPKTNSRFKGFKLANCLARLLAPKSLVISMSSLKCRNGNLVHTCLWFENYMVYHSFCHCIIPQSSSVILNPPWPPCLHLFNLLVTNHSVCSHWYFILNRLTVSWSNHFLLVYIEISRMARNVENAKCWKEFKSSCRDFFSMTNLSHEMGALLKHHIN